MEPHTSVYAWPDGKNYTCFVFTDPHHAKNYKISGEKAQSLYPERNVYTAVRLVALDRFNKSEESS